MNIALIGNQNSGKTTLFNSLTGMNLKVGNWPGVTVEKKEGIIKSTNYNIVDLPGIYSLNNFSLEEQISTNYLLNGDIDLIINVIDGTRLERSLYLTTQLLELDCKVIIVINMADLLEKKEISIGENILSKYLNTPVIKVSAMKNIGIDTIINEIKKQDNNYNFKNNLKIYDNYLEEKISNIQKQIKENIKNKKSIAIKILEDEEYINEYIDKKDLYNIRKEIEYMYNMPIDEVFPTKRYEYIQSIKAKVFTKKENNKNITDYLDKIILNRYLAFPIFVLVMFLVYYISIGFVGKNTINIIQKYLSNFSNNLEILLYNIKINKIVIRLIIDGILKGITSVLVFIPQLAILFLCINILETTGYMSRIALIFDNILMKIGLNGKSIIPFLTATGCSVPAITSSRIIENDSERRLTISLVPFIPCSAKIPIISLFAGYFFSKNSELVCVSVYFLSIIVVILNAYLLNKLSNNKYDSAYVLELPEYRVPDIKYIIKDIYDKVIGFIKRAGSIIFICSIIIWFMTNWSINLEYGINIENSILAQIGKKISWMFIPLLGENSWESSVSILQGLIAKEQVISSMSIIAKGNIFESESFSFFTPLSAYTFIIFNLFSAPCFGAIISMKKELGNIFTTIKVVLYQISFAWIISTTTYQFGNYINNKKINIQTMLIISVLLITIILIGKNKKRDKKSCNNGCNNCYLCYKK